MTVVAVLTVLTDMAVVTVMTNVTKVTVLTNVTGVQIRPTLGLDMNPNQACCPGCRPTPFPWQLHQ